MRVWDETYWAEYWSDFLEEWGVAEYVKVRYFDARDNLHSVYDTPESWSAAVDSHLEVARRDYREALDRLADL